MILGRLVDKRCLKNSTCDISVDHRSSRGSHRKCDGKITLIRHTSKIKDCRNTVDLWLRGGYMAVYVMDSTMSSEVNFY